MAIIHKVPLSPPHREGLTRPTLTADEDAKYQKVLAHFSDPKFVVPGAEEGKGGLMEVERFWIVGLFLVATYVMHEAEMRGS